MNPIIYLSQADATRVKKNEQNTFVMPLSEQPPRENEYMVMDTSGRHGRLDIVHFDNDYDQPCGAISPIPCGRVTIPLRYSLRTYRVKESWDWFACDYMNQETGEHEGHEEGWLYKADGVKPCGKWHSSASMPAEAVRWELDVKTSVKRVQELTFEEIVATGIFGGTGFIDAINLKPFIDYWNARHAKPVKTKDGKGYECFPYDFDRVEYVSADYYFDIITKEYTYKGLPLTIHANCWVMVLECDRGVV